MDPKMHQRCVENRDSLGSETLTDGDMNDLAKLSESASISMERLCAILRTYTRHFDSATFLSHRLRFQQITLSAGSKVNHADARCNLLYVIESGTLKTSLIDETGNRKIILFPMRGQIIGMDAICDRRHVTETVALSTCTLIIVPYKVLFSLAAHHPISIALMRIFSAEILRRRLHLIRLKSFPVLTRLRSFLLEASADDTDSHYKKSIMLPMSRREIANFLNTSHESVSRSMSALQCQGKIKVKGRQITIDNVDALHEGGNSGKFTHRFIDA